MSKKWTQTETRTLIRHLEAGKSQNEIADLMGKTQGSVHGMVKRIRDREDKLDFGLALDARGAKTVVAPAPKQNDGAYACLAHWRDLDQHHPRGWPSYRIPPDYHSKIRTSISAERSLTGSAAAMCSGD
jgi:hypothetical protein